MYAVLSWLSLCTPCFVVNKLVTVKKHTFRMSCLFIGFAPFPLYHTYEASNAYSHCYLYHSCRILQAGRIFPYKTHIQNYGDNTIRKWGILYQHRSYSLKPAKRKEELQFHDSERQPMNHITPKPVIPPLRGSVNISSPFFNSSIQTIINYSKPSGKLLVVFSLTADNSNVLVLIEYAKLCRMY